MLRNLLIAAVLCVAWGRAVEARPWHPDDTYRGVPRGEVGVAERPLELAGHCGRGHRGHHHGYGGGYGGGYRSYYRGGYGGPYGGYGHGGGGFGYGGGGFGPGYYPGYYGSGVGVTIGPRTGVFIGF